MGVITGDPIFRLGEPHNQWTIHPKLKLGAPNDKKNLKYLNDLTYKKEY